MIEFHYMGLYKVISGGQTGADQAGLHTAENFGLQTGGYIARGYRTIFGPQPNLKRFNLVEHTSYDYPPRTKANATEGDATVRLATNFNSAGEILTLKYVRKANKPVFDILLDGKDYERKGIELASFIKLHNVKVLNVAGNADRDKPYGHHFYHACDVLRAAFKCLESEGLLVKS